MELLKKLEDKAYYVADGIDEVLAYMDDLAYEWKQGKEYNYLYIDRMKYELTEAYKDAKKMERIIHSMNRHMEYLEEEM
jgi:hypothetical protein